MLNFADMFGKIQKMQDEMKKAREKLDEIIVDAEAGGGMVRVKANANRKILKIEIDPDIIDPKDPEIMADLVAAAVNKALENAETVAREEIKKVSSDALPNIPGLDLSKLGLDPNNI